jgi:hypothetical protein
MSENFKFPVERENQNPKIADSVSTAAKLRPDTATPPGTIASPRELSFAQGSPVMATFEALQGKEAPKDAPQKDLDALRREANERAKLLLEDSAKGAWSKKSQETWRKLYEDMSKIPGATPEGVAKAMNKLGATINEQLEKKRSPYRVGMALGEENGQHSVYMQLNGPGINKIDNVNAILEGKDTPTSVKAGSMTPKSRLNPAVA